MLLAAGIAFVILLFVRLLLVRKYQQRSLATVRTAVKDQLAAWLLIATILAGIFLVVLLFGLFFGPISPVHEWGQQR